MASKKKSAPKTRPRAGASSPGTRDALRTQLAALAPAGPHARRRQIAESLQRGAPVTPPRRVSRPGDPRRERLVQTLMTLAPASPDDARQRVVLPLASLAPSRPPKTIPLPEPTDA